MQTKGKLRFFVLALAILVVLIPGPTVAQSGPEHPVGEIYSVELPTPNQKPKVEYRAFVDDSTYLAEDTAEKLQETLDVMSRMKAQEQKYECATRIHYAHTPDILEVGQSAPFEMEGSCGGAFALRVKRKEWSEDRDLDLHLTETWTHWGYPIRGASRDNYFVGVVNVGDWREPSGFRGIATATNYYDEIREGIDVVWLTVTNNEWMDETPKEDLLYIEKKIHRIGHPNPATLKLSVTEEKAVIESGKPFWLIHEVTFTPGRGTHASHRFYNLQDWDVVPQILGCEASEGVVEYNPKSVFSCRWKDNTPAPPENREPLEARTVVITTTHVFTGDLGTRARFATFAHTESSVPKKDRYLRGFAEIGATMHISRTRKRWLPLLFKTTPAKASRP